jgi:hypothetical protein
MLAVHHPAVNGCVMGAPRADKDDVARAFGQFVSGAVLIAPRLLDSPRALAL